MNIDIIKNSYPVDVEALVKENKLVSCTRQTIQMPIEMLLKPDKIDYYRDYVEKHGIDDNVRKECMICSYKELTRSAYGKNIIDCLKKNANLKYEPKTYEIVKPIDVSLPDFNINKNNNFDIICHDVVIEPMKYCQQKTIDSIDALYGMIPIEGNDGAFYWVCATMYEVYQRDIRIIIEINDDNVNDVNETHEEIYYYHTYNDIYSKECLDHSIEPVTIDYAGYIKHLGNLTKWDYLKYDVVDPSCRKSNKLLILE